VSNDSFYFFHKGFSGGESDFSKRVIINIMENLEKIVKDTIETGKEYDVSPMVM
jgi:hypothetical protein